MIEVAHYSSDGAEKEKIFLPENLFGQEVKEASVHHYIKSYLQNQRQGTANTLQRNAVRGGAAKPWRQKGTGRARAGTIRSPIWVGGGRAFGSHPRDFYSRIPKKMKRVALVSVLSDRAKEGKVHVIDLPKLEAPKTKKVAEWLKNIGIDGNKVLILLTERDDNFILSCRNLRNVECMRASLVNAYKVLWAEYLLLSADSVKVLEEVFAK